MWNFRAWFWILRRSDDSFGGVTQDDIRELIAGQKITDERATISCDNRYLFCS
jgi:hypothetical protein